MMMMKSVMMMMVMVMIMMLLIDKRTHLDDPFRREVCNVSLDCDLFDLVPFLL